MVGWGGLHEPAQGERFERRGRVVAAPQRLDPAGHVARRDAVPALALDDPPGDFRPLLRGQGPVRPRRGPQPPLAYLPGAQGQQPPADRGELGPERTGLGRQGGHLLPQLRHVGRLRFQHPQRRGRGSQGEEVPR